MKRAHILYGDEKVEIKIPNSADILETTQALALRNILGAVEKAIAKPIGSPLLAKPLEYKQPGLQP